MPQFAQSVFCRSFVARRWRAVVLAAAAVCGLAPTSAALAAGAHAAPAYTGHIIVRWRDDTTAAADGNGTSKTPAAADALKQLSDRTGIAVTARRAMGGNLQLVQVPDDVAADPEAAAARLRQDPHIADAVPDRWLKLHDTLPNDPEFQVNQPYLMGTGTAVGGVNLPHAWDRSRGSSGVVIAVVDTGYLPHPDLAARLLPGYDFISDPTISNDGDGRDSDPTDAGDNVPAGFTCPGSSTPTKTATYNSWHGTRVAGVLGALTNNGQDIAGVDWNARILPVRVSGRCGALLSDTVEGMRWAGGLSVPGVPDNPTPARVVNISLGGGTCSSIEQQAVNDLNARGVVVVAAAGNNNTNNHQPVEAPADCAGVIAVTAHANDGENANYADVGPQVTLSAPGGGCGSSRFVNDQCTVTPSVIRTLSNDGKTSLGNYWVSSSAGTSFAAPMVSGVVSMMFAVNGALTPAQVTAALKASARPHPAGTYCTTNPGVCGAGLLDADGALVAAAATPAAPAPASTSGGGGGGGGTVAPWTALLLALAGLLTFALRRRA